MIDDFLAGDALPVNQDQTPVRENEHVTNDPKGSEQLLALYQ